MKHFVLYLAISLCSLVTIIAQTGYTDNFDTDPGWSNTSHYYPSHQDSVEYLRVVKTDAWAGIREELGDTIDISGNEYLNLKVKAEPPIILYVYLVDTSGNHTGAIGVRVPEGDNFINLCWDFNGRFTTADSTAISEIIIAVNGSADEYTGDVWFDDLKIGTDAALMANLGRVDDQVHFKNSGSQSVLITDIENAGSITAGGAAGLIQNIIVTPVSGGNATLTYDVIAGATGTGKVTLTAVGAGAYQDNTYTFNIAIEDNLPPVMDTVTNMKAGVGVHQSIRLTGISDGNESLEQLLTFKAASDDTAIIPEVYIVYEQYSSDAFLKFTPIGVKDSVTITIKMKDDGGGNDSANYQFSVNVFANYSYNFPPTIDDVQNQAVYETAGQQTLYLTGITDGDDSTTQSLSVTAASSVDSILGTTTPTIIYTSDEDTAKLIYTPQNIGTTTITISVDDDGGTTVNNGNQQTQINFELEVITIPQTGYNVPLEDFDTTNASSNENVGDWKIEENMISQFCDVGSYHGYDTVLRIQCVNKNAWKGLWHRTPDLDLTNYPFVSYDMYVETIPIQTRCYFWDDNDERNSPGTEAEEKSVPADAWTSLTMNYRPDGFMENSSGEPINDQRIQQLLFNYDDDFIWPFDDGGNFTVYIKNIRVGSEAENIPLPYCTIDAVGDDVQYENPGQQTITLTGITDGDIQDNTPTVTASSSNPGFVPDPTVSAVDTNGTATLIYTPAAGINSATITLTVSATNSLDKQMTFDIITVSEDPADGDTVVIDQATTHQIIRGFGEGNFNERYIDLIVNDLGSSLLRTEIDLSTIEPENDNNDPNVLNRDNLNYSGIDWDYYRTLKAAGVENFIITISSPPSWMMDDLSTNYQMTTFQDWSVTNHRLSTWYYDELAETAVALVKMFKEKCGIDLFAIAPQKEPRQLAPFPSCVYDAAHYVDIINEIGDRFTAEGITTKIMMPEQPSSDNPWNTDRFIDSVQANATADGYTDAISIFDYMGDGMEAGSPDFSNWDTLYNEVTSSANPKELYMSRTYGNASGTDIVWDSALAIAGAMYGALEVGNIGLWSWSTINDNFIYKEQPTHIFYAVKHYYKFIRPNARRVTTTSPDVDILATSFLNDPKNKGSLVSVYVNKGNSPFTMNLSVSGGNAPDTIDIYRSTANTHCELISTQPSDSIFILPPKSVTTVVAYSTSNIYNLTVDNGSGDGEYGSGALIDIVADDPPVMKLFDKWVGDTTNVDNPDTTNALVTMPASDITVTAVYKDIPTYTLTVNRGSGDGDYAFGAPVEVIADAPHADSVFSHWIGDTAYINDYDTSVAAITMPKADISITPVYVPLDISIDNVTLAEGDAGATTFTFTVSVANPPIADITIDYTTNINTATTADNDFNAASGTITIPAYNTSATIDITVNGDVKYETDEEFTVDISNASSGIIVDAQGTGTINNDDTEPTVSINDVSTTEGGDLDFTVSLSNPSYQTITIDYATSDGSATTLDNDYTAISTTTLTFNPDETSKTITVLTTTDDKFEMDETVNVDLSNPTNSTIPDNQGVGTINNDDTQPDISIDDVAVIEGGNLSFTVSLTNASYQTITVDYATSDGTATTADSDYSAIATTTLTFNPDETSKNIIVSTTADTKYETNEDLNVDLSNPSNATIADNQGVGTINNDDTQPEISIDDVAVIEGGNLSFTVSLTNASYQTITLDYATSDGTATTADSDYSAIATTTLTFNPDETSKNISVSTTADTKYETNEDLNVDLSNPSNATIADNQGVGTINNDDTQPEISIDDVAVIEGGNLSFTVSLTNASHQTITVDYATSDGTATTADSDYSAIATTTLTFNPDETSKNITVSTTADTKYETNEDLNVDLSNPSNATIADNQGVGTINNDDTQPEISIDDVAVIEGGNLSFTVSLTNASYQTITLDYATSDGTATTADSDYSAIATTTLTFNPDETSKNISVSTTADTKYETNEDLNVDLSNPSNATIADNQGVGTINNDDTQPEISIDDVAVIEGGNLSFTVSLTNASYQTITVDYATSDGTATTADSDYSAIATTTLTFNPDETSKNISVSTTADTKYETNEDLNVDLSNPSNATIADNQGVGTINNDDTQPEISIDDVAVIEGGNLSFTVSLTNASYQTITVDYATSDGTATTADSDYSAIATTTLTFNPDETSKNISVSTTADTKYETNEDLNVDLSNPSNASIADNQGVGTINNDDSQPTITIDDVSTTEGGSLSFTVSLSDSSHQTITVDYATSDGTATLADNDYSQITTTTLTFNPDQTIKNIVVATTTDIKFEPNETVNLDLSNPSNATITDNQGVGTINDDDSQPTITIDDVSIVEGGNLVFTITLSNASYQTITVDHATSDGTATIADNDYTQIPLTTTTFNPDEVSKTITLSTITDVKNETNEIVYIDLSNQNNATFGDNQGEGTIIDDDGPPSLYINNTSVSEGGTLDFTVNLTNPSSDTITVDYATSDGNATLADNDYVPIAITTLTFLPDDTSKNISVNTLEDTKFEPDETVNLNLTNSVNAPLSDSLGVGTITNDDTQPAITIDNVAIVEGGNLVFTISLSDSSYQTVSVYYATSDSTATTTDNDYTEITNTQLIFSPDETSKTITINTTADAKFETDEEIKVDLSNVNNGTIADNKGVGTISNDDTQPSISINNDSVAEGGNLVFTVRLNNASYQTITVDYATSDNTATTADNDYTGISTTTLTFNPDDTSKTVTVITLPDARYEADENMYVDLSNASNATINDNQGTGSITNNDLLPAISINNVSTAEGDTLVFSVSLSNPSYQTITVDYATTDSTATATDNDYIPLALNTLTFDPDTTSKTISVISVEDTKYETDELVNLNLSNASNASIANNKGIGTITNDDGLPTISIDDVIVNEGDTINFTISMSDSSHQTITVDYATGDGTATITDNDYTSIDTTTLTFNPNETSKTIKVTTNDDTKYEMNETVLVNLFNVSNAVISDNQGLGTINDNDSQPAISINNDTVQEGDTLSFTVTLSNPSYQTITLYYATNDSTATTADNDYTEITNTPFSFSPDDTSSTISVYTVSDTKFEIDEIVKFSLSNITNATFDDDLGLGIITNEDLQPTINITDTTVDEGGDLNFILNLSNPSYQTVTVDYSTNDSTATIADNDYTQVISSTITFNPGDTIETAIITTIEDSKNEASEFVNVLLTNPVNASINDNKAVGTINNDDGIPSLSINDTSVTEGGNLYFTLSLSNASTQTITVEYATSDGTALVNDNDYTSVDTTILTFDPNDTVKIINVSTITDTRYEETNETLFLNLFNITNATIANNQGMGTIIDNDVQPSLSINDISADEGDTLIFTISLSDSSYQSITVDYATSDGTALVADNDYTAVTTTTITFSPYEINKTIHVITTEDAKYETDETMTVNLSNAVNASITDSQGTGTIINDDQHLLVTLDGSQDVLCNGDSTGSIKINIFGGYAPYNYQWNNNDDTSHITGLTAGTYFVTVTDSTGLSVDTTFRIYQPSSININKDINHVRCYGESNGSISLLVDGGIPDYEYSWSNGSSTSVIQGLNRDTFNVTVTDANNCKVIDTFFIEEPDTLIITGQVLHESALGSKDGEINTTTAGGRLPYSYSWNNDSDYEDLYNLKGGDYYVTVSDTNNCWDSASFVINDGFIPNAFSPDANGINDNWQIPRLIDEYPNAEIFVYDRWGILVFHTKKYSKPWDGKSMKTGEPLPQNSYHYIIYLNDGSGKRITGNVTIVRSTY